MSEHPTFDPGEPAPLPAPGEPIDLFNGARIETVKDHPTDPDLVLVTRINLGVGRPFPTASVEHRDEAIAEARQWAAGL